MADDKKSLLALVAIFVSLIGLLALATWFMLPLVADFFATYFSPGLGLRSAAVISFFVTIITLVIFAVAAGDGLLGELQFMLSAFLAFFLVIWLMLAWIF
jgi:hypothetical protein